MLTQLPAKVTASELAGKASKVQNTLARPRFMSSFGLTPAERGTALHEFMQFADYEAASRDAQAECGRIVKQGYLTPQQAQAIDLSKAQSFFQSPLGKRMLVSTSLEKEKRFTGGTAIISCGNTSAGTLKNRNWLFCRVRLTAYLKKTVHW